MPESEGHMTRALLMAYLDGELAGEADERAARHLGTCGSCSRTLEELRGASVLFGRAVPALDAPVPEREAASVREAAAERSAASVPGGTDVADRGRRPAARWAALLKAAVLVLGVATAAAAVVPDSPLREWLVGTVGELTGGSSAAPGTAAAPASEETPVLETVSIAVAGRAVVQIEDPAPGLRVVVRTTDTGRLSVSARGARFETGEGSIGVVGPRAPELSVELPRAAASARISSGERLLLERERGAQRVHVPADTIPGGLVLTLGGAGAGG